MTYAVDRWLPGKLKDDGQREPSEPCPQWLTLEQAIRYLQFDQAGDPRQVFDRWKADVGLVGVKAGATKRYDPAEIDRLLRENT